MPPTRGHDLKPGHAGPPPIRFLDAPHTGARLETRCLSKASCAFVMPPTRGHDLKRGIYRKMLASRMMPPTRGHDLKPYIILGTRNLDKMPPTRGHDLKLAGGSCALQKLQMPPTRGHDLKLKSICLLIKYGLDAPHTGARLETLRPGSLFYFARCPPHGGTT